MVNLLNQLYVSPAAATAYHTKEWIVHLAFYNLTSDTDDDVATWCNSQLRQVKDIWCTKGALNIVVNPSVQPPPRNNLGKNFTANGASNLPRSTIVNGIIWHRLYIVSRLSGLASGQGLTFFSGTSEAYIVLDVRGINGLFPASNNPFLLAHELGHVLGLNHPQESWGPHSIPANPARSTIMNIGVPNLNALSSRELLIYHEIYENWYITLKASLAAAEQTALDQFAFLVSAQTGSTLAYFKPDP